jgi:hypothetical protein
MLAAGQISGLCEVRERSGRTRYPRDMITNAERPFPVSIMIGVHPAV